ncbi:MAG: DUF4412 domain-containing protein [Candidatus Competibacteraceae bacterium]|nr:DUF4412 domain-containing protein [Candidatus Competibacteraceae bacterium]
MKNLFLSVVFVLASAAVFSQSVGEIKYSIQISGSKEIEESKAFFPSHYRMLFKGKESKFVQEGGMMGNMLGDVVTKGDGKTYFVNHSTKTINAYTPKESSDKSDAGEKPTVTKENETAKILGYTCQKFKVLTEKDKQGEQSTIYVWATKDLKVDAKGNKKWGAGQYQYDGVEGFPLKMMIVSKAQGSSMTMTMTAVNLETKIPDDKEFELPASYKREEGLPAMLKMAEMMGGSN